MAWRATVGLGTAGIGKGGLHSTVIADNPLGISIAKAGVDAEKALREIDANPALVNTHAMGHGSLKAAVDNLTFSLDGAVAGDSRRQQDANRVGARRAFRDGGDEGPAADVEAAAGFCAAAAGDAVAESGDAGARGAAVCGAAGDARDAYRKIILAGGRLSAEESRDPTAVEALQIVFERSPDLQRAYR